jgi:DNA-cytosine methyltransferase
MKNILSLFDGISCARIALRNVDSNEFKYYASEVDKFAIQCSKQNYSDIIHLGDVRNVNSKDFEKVYLIVGGTPCQNLSSIGNRKGLKGKQSSLFYEYVRILKEIKPKFFLMENVGSMTKQNRKDIFEELSRVYSNVRQYFINSKLFVPQSRNRIYWTNIPVDISSLPTSQPLIVQDLLEENVDDKYYLTEHGAKKSFTKALFNEYPISDRKIAKVLTTNPSCHRAMSMNFYHTEHKPEGKSNLRKLTPKEYERLQGIPEDYTSCLSNTQRYKTIGNSFTVPVIEWFFAHIF